MGEVTEDEAWREGLEETDEEAELAWQAAIMAQMQADGVDPGDEEAERAWLEALSQQQGMTTMEDEEDDDADEFEEAYYEELYKNTRMNEGDVTQGESIETLNEQKWALMNSKKQYEEHLQRHSLNAIAMQALLADLPKQLPKTTTPSPSAPPSNAPRPKGAPLKGILRNHMSRVDIDNRMTLRMRKAPMLLQMEIEAAGRPKKTVNFYLTDEQAEKQRIKQALEEAEANSMLDEQAFLNMSLQFIDDYNREELLLQQERERLEAMEAQIRALEAEIAAGEANNNSAEEPSPAPAPARAAAPSNSKAAQAPAPNKPVLPPKPVAPSKPQQPPPSQPHKPPQAHKQPVPAPAPAPTTNDQSHEGLNSLQMRAKRGTKGFGGVFLSEVHRLLEEDEKKKAEEDKAKRQSPRGAQQAAPASATSPRNSNHAAAGGGSSSPRKQSPPKQQQKGSAPAPKARAPAAAGGAAPSRTPVRRGTGPSSTSPPKQAPSTPQKGPVAAAAAAGGPASAKKYYSPPPQRTPAAAAGRGAGPSPSVGQINRTALQHGADNNSNSNSGDRKRVEENKKKDLDSRRKVQESVAMRMRRNKEKLQEEAQRRQQAIQEAADLKNAIPNQRAPASPKPVQEEDPLEGRKRVTNLRSMFSARIQEEETEVARMKQKLLAPTAVSEDAKFRDERMKRLEMMRNQILAKKEGGASPRKVSG